MKPTNTGAGLRTVTALAIGTLLVGCEDTAVPVGPSTGSESTTTEVLLDEATMSLASMEQEMASEVEAERERDRARARDRIRDRVGSRRPFPDRAALAVELAGSAVSLAGRILDEQGAAQPQLRLLDSAAEFLRKAEAALAEADLPRAISFAQKACWSALKAVVLPGGISEEEARMIHQVAGDLLEAARAEVEAGGDPLETVLLGWAKRFFEVGSTQLEGGNIHGVAALWKSAVVSAWIVG